MYCLYLIIIQNPKKAARTRRFIIAEAIYMNTGELCPLARLVELRQQYKLRLFLDETVSFGTIGRNGRGITEFLNVNVSVSKIEFNDDFQWIAFESLKSLFLVRKFY